MADGADEIEQRMKKAKQDDGAGEGTEPDLDLAQHFKVSSPHVKSQFISIIYGNFELLMERRFG